MDPASTQTQHTFSLSCTVSLNIRAKPTIILGPVVARYPNDPRDEAEKTAG